MAAEKHAFGLEGAPFHCASGRANLCKGPMCITILRWKILKSKDTRHIWKIFSEHLQTVCNLVNLENLKFGGGEVSPVTDPEGLHMSSHRGRVARH